MKSVSVAPLELGGREYKTIMINNRLWMAENLSLAVKDSWFYGDNTQNGEKYGRLYSWYAAMEACPEGWRLPLDKDWDELVELLGGDPVASQKLISGGESGFKALFSGYRTLYGDYLSLDRAADFWTSTEAGSMNAWLRYVLYKKDKVFKIIDDKRCGFSVRYLKVL